MLEAMLLLVIILPVSILTYFVWSELTFDMQKEKRARDMEAEKILRDTLRRCSSRHGVDLFDFFKIERKDRRG